GFRVAKQQLVEVSALDVVRHRVALVPRPLEDDRPRAAGLLVPEEGAVLLLEAGGADLLRDAERFEDRKVEREQRLSHVKAREPLLLEDGDRAAGPRESRRDRRARGPAADDDRVVEFGHCRILARLPRSSFEMCARRSAAGRSWMA